jgi:hypothetical protein
VGFLTIRAPTPEVESPMSTERLDRSQESFDLKEALFAGVAKSRFSRIAQRFELHAVVGTIIFLATLLYLGLLFGSVFLQKRLPNPNVFLYMTMTLGPLSVGYVTHQNLGLLRRIWEEPWGKLAYSLVASLTVIGCKVLADRQIPILIESNPSLFPSAQQLITALYIIGAILLETAIIMIVPVYYQLLKGVWLTLIDTLLWPLNVVFRFRLREMFGFPPRTFRFRSFASLLTRFSPHVWGSFSILFLLPFFDSGFAEFGGKPFSPTEALLLWSSFIPNDRGLAGSDRVCVNLPPDTLVSAFNTRDPIPDKVVMAQPISADPDRLGRSYTYRVIACSKPIGSGAFLGTDHGN